ncbi:hypothetical protein COOONC_05200 [Cooperia oncophora]
MVKRLKVDYEEDPFIRTSTSEAKKPSVLRPIKKVILEPSAAVCAEDPFSSCTIKYAQPSSSLKEPSEPDGKEGSRNSTAANVFRETFSSLNDRVSCRLAAFKLKKSR